jgi:hypothetical protein
MGGLTAWAAARFLFGWRASDEPPSLSGTLDA